MKTYGLLIEVTMEEHEDEGLVRIAATDPVPAPAMMIAVEHMMNWFAGESDMGYELALALLCEGARKAKRRLT
jgi:hypothetical protein